MNYLYINNQDKKEIYRTEFENWSDRYKILLSIPVKLYGNSNMFYFKNEATNNTVIVEHRITEAWDLRWLKKYIYDRIDKTSV